MSRIADTFRHLKQAGNRKVLSVYCTAGFPALISTIPLIRSLQQYGADMVEIGIPYSDPLADGPVIQSSGARALANGMTIAVLFQQLEHLRDLVQIPVILMGYLNPILQYGMENFCKVAQRVGVDGLIVPDLPVHEFDIEYGATIKNHGLDFTFLVTPETSEDRVRKLDRLSSGFLYAVSSSSVTGKEKDFSEVQQYAKRLQGMQLQNPIMVGFGIRDKQTFSAACQYADGGIIGTAYIKAIENADDPDQTTKKFLASILQSKYDI